MVQPKKPSNGVETSNGSSVFKDSRRPNGSTFRTDTAISGNRGQGERKLERWVPDADAHTSSLSLESSDAHGGAWDQFAVNEHLFGLKTDYDENIYTTVIDKSHPDYHRRYAEADRMAREIEGSASTNRHIVEERIVDNVTADDSGLDEEDKYSGVQRTEFAPSKVSGGGNKYTPPGRRRASLKPSTSPKPGPATTNPSDMLTDPAIISARRPEKLSSDAAKPAFTTNSSIVEASPRKALNNANLKTTSNNQSVPGNATTSGNRAQSPHVNATATVEQDVLSSFKGFAQQQRVQADKLRSSKLKADKEVKLHELKKFAANFKLNSPLPNDLVTIIAKDPEKRKQIQETARRNAEEAEKMKQAKVNSTEASTPPLVGTDTKSIGRPSMITSPAAASGTTPRGGNRAAQGSYTNQQYKTSNQPPQAPSNLHSRPGLTLSDRLRTGLEQTRNGTMRIPTGPSSNLDPLSRRSSGTVNVLGPKLNPSSSEFRPNAFAQSFSPNGNHSTASSPRSTSISGVGTTVSLLRRKSGSKSANKITLQEKDILQANVAIPTPPMKNWEKNGEFKPAFETPLLWRTEKEQEPDNSTMRLTYFQVLEKAVFRNSAISPRVTQVYPQVPHQHQLPFHLQQGAHNIQHRQSPRQPQMHLQNNQHGHQTNSPFVGGDDHRMMASHSAQSYSSPRLPHVNMAPYPAPMGQSQVPFNPSGGIPYVVAPGAPQMQSFRSYSGGHSHLPQPGHIGPVMIAQHGNFMSGQAMPLGAPPILYQPHFVTPSSAPPPMAGSNGYPSPGRGAPMMISQNSQPGQSVYGSGAGMPNVQPHYGPPQHGQGSIMRGNYHGPQSLGSSPQMHHYGHMPQRGPGSNYNSHKNFQPQTTSQHQSHQSGHSPSGGQARPSIVNEEVK